MIINHQNNVAAFAGAHTVMWAFQPIVQQSVSVTTVFVAQRVVLIGGIVQLISCWFSMFIVRF